MQGSNVMPRGKGPGSAWVGVILLLLVIGIVCFGFFVYPNFSKDLKQNNPSDSTPNNNENTDTNTETTDNQNNNNNSNTDTSKPKDTYQTLKCNIDTTNGITDQFGNYSKLGDREVYTLNLNFTNNIINLKKSNTSKGVIYYKIPTELPEDLGALENADPKITTLEQYQNVIELMTKNMCASMNKENNCIFSKTSEYYIWTISYDYKNTDPKILPFKGSDQHATQKYSEIKSYLVKSGYTCK